MNSKIKKPEAYDREIGGNKRLEAMKVGCDGRK
jgi:hypothetical protein